LTFPTGALARTSCAYVGAPTNALTVKVKVSGNGAVPEIKREGKTISVRGEDGRSVGCAGAPATVLNTDTIEVTLVDVDFVDLNLGGGPFAPGATPEPNGAPEIEIEITARLGDATIIGTQGDDEWHWQAAGANPGLNLNPREAGDKDVDVTVTAKEDETGPLIADGEGGNDTIIGAPGAKVRGLVIANGGPGNDVLSAPRLPRGSLVGAAQLNGGSGDDVITGGTDSDRLSGGPGADRVDGRAGDDEINGEPGRDRLFGGTGRDVITSRDFAGDKVFCGAGRDRVRADRHDRVSGCEQLAPR